MKEIKEINSIILRTEFKYYLKRKVDSHFVSYIGNNYYSEMHLYHIYKDIKHNAEMLYIGSDKEMLLFIAVNFDLGKGWSPIKGIKMSNLPGYLSYIDLEIEDTLITSSYIFYKGIKSDYHEERDIFMLKYYAENNLIDNIEPFFDIGYDEKVLRKFLRKNIKG